MENSRKILIFSTAYYPFVGGAEVAIKEITDRIPGVQFDLITAKLKRDLSKIEKIGNINVYRLGIGVPLFDKLLLPFWGAIKTIKLNDKNHYDSFWCMMVSFASGAAYIANVIHFWKRVPIILTLQEGDSESHLKDRWLGLIHLSWRLALKGASTVTAISSYLARRAGRLGYKGKVEIIPNGVDIAKFYRNVDVNKLKTKFSNTDNTDKVSMDINYANLVTVSRLVEKNGIEDIIQALSKLPGEQPRKFKLYIFGNGPMDKKLRELAVNLGLNNKNGVSDTDRVIFLGYKDHEKIIEYFDQYFNVATIFIRPSRSEGMGNAFLEAMAYGIPVIGTNAGGISDFLEDEKTGLVCNINDPESIKNKVTEYFRDSDKTAKIAENASKMVREKYDWNLIAKQMEKVFDGINSNKIK